MEKKATSLLCLVVFFLAASPTTPVKALQEQNPSEEGYFCSDFGFGFFADIHTKVLVNIFGQNDCDSSSNKISILQVGDLSFDIKLKLDANIDAKASINLFSQDEYGTKVFLHTSLFTDLKFTGSFEFKLDSCFPLIPRKIGKTIIKVTLHDVKIALKIRVKSVDGDIVAEVIECSVLYASLKIEGLPTILGVPVISLEGLVVPILKVKLNAFIGTCGNLIVGNSEVHAALKVLAFASLETTTPGCDRDHSITVLISAKVQVFLDAITSALNLFSYYNDNCDTIPGLSAFYNRLNSEFPGAKLVIRAAVKAVILGIVTDGDVAIDGNVVLTVTVYAQLDNGDLRALFVAELTLRLTIDLKYNLACIDGDVVCACVSLVIVERYESYESCSLTEVEIGSFSAWLSAAICVNLDSLVHIYAVPFPCFDHFSFLAPVFKVIGGVLCLVTDLVYSVL
jgi:hypothetical protein